MNNNCFQKVKFQNRFRIMIFFMMDIGGEKGKMNCSVKMIVNKLVLVSFKISLYTCDVLRPCPIGKGVIASRHFGGIQFCGVTKVVIIHMMI
jgi:hypothetical protein